MFFTFVAKFKIMAIIKQYLKNKQTCKVTFIVAAKESEKVAVLGDFNNWNPEATSLVKLKNGTFKGVVNLDKNQSYEFRYLIENTYVNDEQADSYKWNSFANAENGIINL